MLVGCAARAAFSGGTPTRWATHHDRAGRRPRPWQEFGRRRARKAACRVSGWRLFSGARGASSLVRRRCGVRSSLMVRDVPPARAGSEPVSGVDVSGGVGQGQDAGEDSWTELEEVRPDLAEALPIRHGMVLGGRYTIEKVLGRGGSGVVVRAHDRDLKEAVAIKIVRADLAGEQVWAARLAREVKLARQIQHPHVCRVFDFQHADGRVFLVMELASKGTLRDEIRAGKLMARPLPERIADARAVASALWAIHKASIVHRDLTPQ